MKWCLNIRSEMGEEVLATIEQLVDLGATLAQTPQHVPFRQVSDSRWHESARKPGVIFGVGNDAETGSEREQALVAGKPWNGKKITHIFTCRFWLLEGI